MRSRCLFLIVASLTWTLGFACDDQVTVKDSCGDGFIDPGEQCDRAELDGASCESLGFYLVSGTLACKADCTYNVSDCGHRCGDSIVDDLQGEQCDGGNLSGQTCATLGFTGGLLSCRSDCQYDVSSCQSLCGNGLKDLTEECDDFNAIPGDGCSSTCRVESGWSCYQHNPSVCIPTCGDDLVVGAEECDGANFDGQTCGDFGFHTGTLACTTGCTVLTSGGSGECGDGEVLSPFEDCDGSDLDGSTCLTEGFYLGSLRCGANCRFDTSQCSGFCGDGQMQAAYGETCDGNFLNGQTCATQG